MDRIGWREYFYDLRFSPIKIPDDWKRYVRMMIAKYDNDPLAKSICEDWRYHMDSNGESCTEYIIYEDCGETDEEIREFVDDLRIVINSPYDCTGQIFTQYIHWKRTPAGIVVIHAKSIDVQSIDV